MYNVICNSDTESNRQLSLTADLSDVGFPQKLVITVLLSSNTDYVDQLPR